jgi:glutamine synthetase
MAAVIDAVDRHGDLMRLAVASPGNDFRLGACEAPPAILSTYLGEDLTAFLDGFRSGGAGEYQAAKKALSAGVAGVAPFDVPSEDRNRTSPFPYGGHRFEFRAVGSSQNVSFVNTVLNSITADAFARFSAAIEGGRKPQEVAAEALGTAWKSIFNGDGYSAEWRDEAERRGVWRIDSGVEAMQRLAAEKNLALFESLGVLSRPETEARRVVMLGHYTGTVEMEAGCMVDMILQHIVPAVAKAGQDTAALAAAAKSVAAKISEVHHGTDPLQKAQLARELRLDTMEAARKVCDEAEGRCPADLWPFATYKELLFLDLNQDGNGQTLRALRV